MELLIGCGENRAKQIWFGAEPTPWKQLIRLDMNPDCKPDVLFDLNSIPLPFKDDLFDEIHAYEVLEHLGTQGDWKFFFNQFDEFARVMKPAGLLFIKSPGLKSPWVWGDPGHTRYMGQQVYTFLNRAEYEKQVGKTAMTDYRRYFKSNWVIRGMVDNDDSFAIILQNVK